MTLERHRSTHGHLSIDGSEIDRFSECGAGIDTRPGMRLSSKGAPAGRMSGALAREPMHVWAEKGGRFLIATLDTPALDFRSNRTEGHDLSGDACEYGMRH